LKLHRFLIVTVAFLVAFGGYAYSQDDTAATDDTATTDDATDDVADDDASVTFSATVEFVSPVELLAETEYDFQFTVTNTTTVSAYQNWISIVDLYMPTEAYEINVDELMAPDALHAGSWTVKTLPEGQTPTGLRWEFSSGVSSLAYGDIRESENLDFAFRAKTDADASDGFDYKITADSGQYVNGTAYIGGEPGDDTDADDTAADDDASDDAGDDDDSSGCGC
jgi:hypothetical protein